MSYIVEKLRSSRHVQAFDSAGRLTEYDVDPDGLPLAAADEITRLRAALNDAYERAARVADKWLPNASASVNISAAEIAAAIGSLKDTEEKT
jgi:hypothetical protein